MKTLAERLNLAITRAGFTQTALAKAIGVKPQSVQALCSGKAKRTSYSAAMAKALNVNADWLESGLGDMDNALHSTLRVRPSLAGALGEADMANTAPASITGQRVPLLSSVQAGHWREIVDAYAGGGADGYVMALEPVGKHGFALTVEGDSMTPDFQPGDTLFINPELQPNPGDFVIARNHQAEATFKRYRPRGLNADGQEYFELVPLNENHPTLRSDLQTIEIIGVVVEHRRRLRAQ